MDTPATAAIQLEGAAIEVLAQHMIEDHGFHPGDYPESDRELLVDHHREDHRRGTRERHDGSEAALDHGH